MRNERKRKKIVNKWFECEFLLVHIQKKNEWKKNSNQFICEK